MSSNYVQSSPTPTEKLLQEIGSSQQVRDLRLAVEYKHCGKHAPGGVLLIPEMDNMRKFHGVIFVRRGLYRNGVFRFTMTLPLEYNSFNIYPEIIFSPPVFNPLIEPKVIQLF